VLIERHVEALGGVVAGAGRRLHRAVRVGAGAGAVFWIEGVLPAYDRICGIARSPLLTGVAKGIGVHYAKKLAGEGAACIRPSALAL
jgi:hypothetical protein